MNNEKDDGIRMAGMEPVYANNFQVMFSPLEISIRFVNLTCVSKQDVAVIQMTPALAKVLAPILAQTVLSYERQHGPIPDVSNKTTVNTVQIEMDEFGNLQ